MGVFTSSSSSDEELSDELLSGFDFAVAVGVPFAAGVLFAAGVPFAGAFVVSSSSELSSLEDDDSAAFETGVFAVGVLGVAVLAAGGLAGIFFGASASESELSEESELLLSAFFVLVGVTAGFALAAGFCLVFSSSSLELSELLPLDSAAGLDALGVAALGAVGVAALDALGVAALDAVGVAALAVGVEFALEGAGLTVFVAGVSSSELSLSELELLLAGWDLGGAALAAGGAAAFFGGSSSSEELSESELLSAGFDGVLGVTAVLGVAAGLGVVLGVWAAALAGASSSELSESVGTQKGVPCYFLNNNMNSQPFKLKNYGVRQLLKKK